MKIKTGDIFNTNEGGSVVVREYRSSYDIDVMHMDSHRYIDTVQAGNLRRGNVKNPYHKSVFGVGFVGVGIHKRSYRFKNNKKTAYDAWVEMLRRCYSHKYQAKYPTYIGCTVYNDWHNLQTFAEWFHKQPNSDNTGFHLDKDLRVAGNKVYSPNTCSFVPYQINGLLTDMGALRGKYPIGVCAHGKGFRVQMSINSNLLRLGTYTTPDIAFSVYKKAKEANVRSMAQEWQDHLHPDVFENLIHFNATEDTPGYRGVV